MSGPAIQVEHLRKRYGDVVAVEDLSFDVAYGEIFCLVGPNGAGKTTTIECIEGHTKPDGGRIRVFGSDPQANQDALKQRVGVQLQESALPDRIRVWESLKMWASFFHKAVDTDQLLEQLGIHHRRNAFFNTLSGGEKQRLFVALALVNDPDLIFLDELTTGLDPHARRGIWELIESLRDRGKTLVLTTHFMDEAERLADRVGIMYQGRLVALDAPDQLITNAGLGNRITMTVDRSVDVAPLHDVRGVTRVEQVARRVTIDCDAGRIVSRVVQVIEQQNAALIDLVMERPSLEDVFLQTTNAETYDPMGER